MDIENGNPGAPGNDEGLPPLETDAPQPEEGKEGEKPEGEEGAEETEQKAEGEEEGDKPKKPSGYARQKDRADRLAAEVEELRQANTRLRGGGPDLSSAEAVDAETLRRVGPKPDQSKYADLIEYNEDVQAWKVDLRAVRREVVREAENRGNQAKADVDTVVKAHQARIADFAKTAPDFHEVMRDADAKGIDAAPHVVRALLSSDNSAELQYHLVKSPQILRDLNRSSPEEAARKIGRLEVQLEAGRPKARSTNAPDPARNPRGGAAAPTDLGKADMEQYAAARAKEEAARKAASRSTRH